MSAQLKPRGQAGSSCPSLIPHGAPRTRSEPTGHATTETRRSRDSPTSCPPWGHRSLTPNPCRCQERRRNQKPEHLPRRHHVTLRRRTVVEETEGPQLSGWCPLPSAATHSVGSIAHRNSDAHFLFPWRSAVPAVSPPAWGCHCSLSLSLSCHQVLSLQGRLLRKPVFESAPSKWKRGVSR